MKAEEAAGLPADHAIPMGWGSQALAACWLSRPQTRTSRCALPTCVLPAAAGLPVPDAVSKAASPPAPFLLQWLFCPSRARSPDSANLSTFFPLDQGYLLLTQFYRKLFICEMTHFDVTGKVE